MKRSYSLSWAAAYVLIYTHTAFAQGGTETVRSVLKDWESRQRRATALSCEATGTTTFAKGCFNDNPSVRRQKGEDVPAADYSFPTAYKWLFALKEDHTRKEVQTQVFWEGKEWIPRTEVICLDGSSIKVFRPKDANPIPKGAAELTIQKADFARFVFEPIDKPLFLTCGVVFTPNVVRAPGHLTVPVAPKEFIYHGTGSIAGRQHVILRTHARKGQFLEYWVDPTKESAVARAITYTRDGKVFMQTEIEYKKISWGWVPDSWRFSSCMRVAGEPNRLDHVQVTRLTMNPETTLADFRFELPSDTRVHDANSGRVYTLGSAVPSAIVNNWWWVALVAGLLVLSMVFLLRKQLTKGRQGA